MATFIISYDAHKVREYGPFLKAVKEAGGVSLLESLWAIELNNTVSEVRDWAHGLFDEDDSIVVLQIKPSRSWATWAAKKAAAWLKEHF